MKLFRTLLLPVVAAVLFSACAPDKPAILVFSKTKGFRHQSIKVGKAALMKIGAEAGYQVDTTESAEAFTEENLKKYRAVIFLSTTGDVLDQKQQNDFMRFIQAGGGYLGIHAAADTEYDWWWYGKLVGGYFLSHPQPQEAELKKVNDFPIPADSLPASWKHFDEWYNYKKLSPDIKVLYNLEETSYTGGENGAQHPIVWYHDFDGGRSFYIGLGHTDESYSNPLFLHAVKKGLAYAVGTEKPDFDKAYTVRRPDDNRFTKVVLKYFLDEPTEMTILPDGRIIFIERKGNVKLYDPKTDSLSLINTFNVATKFEDGMIGITRDPDFEKNNWLYVFYAHPEKSVNQLSRFEFKDGKIDMTSEKQMLEVATQRETCCHTGGSLTFDASGNLFISTGDNTNPFESDGFSPSDGRKGRAPFDARSSSSNTNDLRGKILRIHPEPDGTYTIPEGNLFSKGEEKTRPEIYTMGLRNPYRISVDPKRGWLYWGEVGPDAGNDSPTRGPRGYDEFNLAKAPGYFGWPLFIGNNYPYATYDFETKAITPGQDPKAPKNLSPHNTGKTDLPALSDPFIYYPYSESPDFPLMGTGGRNAMAGPVYYSDLYADKPGAFPDYLDGKLLIYEWMRNWIRLVSLNSDGSILDIEPFMSNTTFNNLIDLEYGPDGKLYGIEYGTKWFAQNEDARLFRVDFNGGNRPPSASLEADQKSGALPLKVSFNATGSQDPDGGKLSYTLTIGEEILNSEDGTFMYEFTQPGVYRPTLTVSDPDGSSSSAELVIIAGNSNPEISISIDGNDTYYFKGKSVNYKVAVTDKEDGSTESGTIAPGSVMVSVDFMEQGYDKTMIAQGHQKPNHPGQLLIAESDCKSCHLTDQKSAGPAYREIAKKYKGDAGAIERLANKIINGGSGVWGDVAMAAHPQISKENAAQMASYILSLANESKESLKLASKITFDKTSAQPFNAQSAYVVTASYEDRGNGAVPPLNKTVAKVLRAPYLTAEDELLLNGPEVQSVPTAGKALMNVTNGSSVTFKNVDLRGVSSISFSVVEVFGMTVGGGLEVYLGDKNGKQAGQVDFTALPGMKMQEGVFVKSGKVSFPAQATRSDVTLVFKNAKAPADKSLFIWLNGQLQ
ncbi:MAG: ThuA domain-containing protein [Cyclobacteriaceae bacterium]